MLDVAALLDDVWALDTKKAWVWYGPLPTVDSGIPGRSSPLHVSRWGTPDDLWWPIL